MILPRSPSSWIPGALGNAEVSIIPAPLLVRDPAAPADALPARACPDTQPPTLLFLHLPRTAGTTFNNILERQYGETGFVRLKREPAPRAPDDGTGAWRAGQPPLGGLSTEHWRQIRAIAGHISIGPHPWLPVPVRYLTLLRDPIDRIVSLYRYVLGQPSHPLHRRLTEQQWSLHDCLTNPILQFNNGQLRALTGAMTHEQLAHGVDDDRLLTRAIRALDEYLDLVGTTDRFDDFVVLAWQRYRWQVPLYRRSNRAVWAAPELDRETLALAERLNAMDRALYQYAQRRLNREIQRAGAAFAKQRAVFDLLNGATGDT